VRRRMFVSPDGREVDEACTGGRGGAGDGRGALRLDGVEALSAFLVQDADQVDDRVGIAHRRRDRIGKTQIGLHGMDLPDPAERLQVSGQFRAAHRDPDPIVPVGQRPHRMAAEKARAAEDGDQLVEVALQSHRRAGIQDGFCAVQGLEHVPKSGSRPSERKTRRHIEALAPSIDNEKTAPYLSPHSPGGGIGRRTSFRY
jgi:hypothetical protein